MAELRGALVPSAGLRTIRHKPSSTVFVEDTKLEHGGSVPFVVAFARDSNRISVAFARDSITCT